MSLLRASLEAFRKILTSLIIKEKMEWVKISQKRGDLKSYLHITNCKMSHREWESITNTRINIGRYYE